METIEKETTKKRVGKKNERVGYVTQGFEYASEPNQKQKVQMEQSFGCGRKLYNEYVNGLYEYLESIGYQNGKIKYKVPSYTTYTNQHEYMKGRKHDSKVFANVKRHFEDALNRYNDDFAWKEKPQYKKSALKKAKNTDHILTFRDLKGLPKFHSKKKGKFSYTTNNYKDPKGNYVLYITEEENKQTKQTEHYLRLPYIGMLRIYMHRPLPEGYIINNVVLKREYDRYMVSVNVDFPFEVEKKQISPEKILGLDYSQQDFFVASNGHRANPPKYYRKAEKKLKRLQRQYSRRYEDENGVLGKNKEKALKKLQKLQNQVKLQRKHWLHTISRQIANEWDCVVLEDLDLRSLSQTLKLAKNVQDNGFGYFRTYLTYKMERQGKVVLYVDRFFPSSKRCSKCHNLHEDLKLKDRLYSCKKCGAEMDRDENAADNLKQEGIRLLDEDSLLLVA